MAKQTKRQVVTLSEVNKKRIRIISYLIVSGILGYLLATYIVNNEALTVIFTPTINFILYSITEELKGDGYIKAIK